MASRKEFACLFVNLDHANRFHCKSSFQDCRNLISAYMSPTTYGSLILSKNGRSVFTIAVVDIFIKQCASKRLSYFRKVLAIILNSFQFTSNVFETEALMTYTEREM